MKIKNGFNGKETELKLNGYYEYVELWLEQDYPNVRGARRKTLCYMTADELLQLINEARRAWLDMIKPEEI